jgi:hypothetical protein
MKVSADLADIVGKKEASRAECIKQLWAYIKKNNLQDPENKQFFTPDKKMAKVIILLKRPKVLVSQTIEPNPPFALETGLSIAEDVTAWLGFNVMILEIVLPKILLKKLTLLTYHGC